jgi:hypothetical protein
MPALQGPFVEWKDNDLRDVAPPPDASEWVHIIATVSRTVVVWLVRLEGGGWRVAKADEAPPAETGDGPFNIDHLDRSDEVREALRKAGKPVE